jgi:hypothetical protein
MKDCRRLKQWFGVASNQALLVCAVLLWGGGYAVTLDAQQAPPSPAEISPSPPVKKGAAGGHRQPVALSVPRTFDLKHVAPAVYAKALGNDPQRIFEFVRDQIAFESYDGCLRGARGTLLAMAGNSVDRSVLLAALLQAGGHRVRYARGTISEADAHALVEEIGAIRETVAPEEEGSNNKPESIAFVPDAIEKEFKTLRSLLPASSSASGNGVSLETLLKETKTHYWVQWQHNGEWIDLDPSFADSILGKALTTTDGTFETLPEELFHQVTIRVRVEEYATDKPSTREVLKVSIKASELAGHDRTLTHWPEKWNGPSKDLSSAISSAVGDTGRVKPVLFVDADFIQGQSFQQKAATTGGLPAIGGMLRGEGTRKTPSLATAEFIDFEFKSPAGHTRAVTREIFDVIGPSRRTANVTLNRSEIEDLINGPEALRVNETVFNLYFSTGEIDPSNFAGPAPDDTASESDHFNVIRFLRNIGFLFTSGADAIMSRATLGETPLIFYPDSPRVVISSLLSRKGSLNITLDLRQTHVRAIAVGGKPPNLFVAQMFRGVAEATLERALLRLVSNGTEREEASSSTAMSGSELFQRAQSQGIKFVLLTKSQKALPEASIARDALARLSNDLDKHFIAVAPERSIEVGGAPRFAWWRVDPNSGESIAVSDDGLYACEYKATITTHSVSETADAELVLLEDGVEVEEWPPAKFKMRTREYSNFLRFLREVVGAKITILSRL